MELFHKMISAALNISEKQINNTLNLLKDSSRSSATVILPPQ